MIRTIRMLQHYTGAFRATVKANGWRFALQRTAGVLRRQMPPAIKRRLAKRLKAVPSETISPFAPIVETLSVPKYDRPLVIIISDIAIRQCVHYRIDQKLRFLSKIGIKAMHFFPTETGRINSFVSFAHTVIIYRTAIDLDQIARLKATGARVIFEFDDLVVGEEILQRSNILAQVSKPLAASLVTQARAFQKTAQACDAILVSTPQLAEIYGRPEHGLSDKQCHVVPNFIETADFAAPAEKTTTFAYTSPSGSVRDELAMLTGFLDGYDRAAATDWTLLVIGNPLVSEALEQRQYMRGTISAAPFLGFADYLNVISSSETVLIPLSDTEFNRAKTPIRLMDAAVAGTQALFCPVGAYQDIGDKLTYQDLCVPGADWPTSGGSLTQTLARLDKNVADMQRVVKSLYGIEAAQRCFQQVFVEELGLAPVGQSQSGAVS